MVINKYQGHLFSASQVGYLHTSLNYASSIEDIEHIVLVPEHVFIGMCSHLGHAQLVSFDCTSKVRVEKGCLKEENFTFFF